MSLSKLMGPMAMSSFDCWYYILVVFVLYKTQSIFMIYFLRRPKGIKTTGAPTLVGQCLSGIWNSFGAAATINQAYDESGGGAFAIPMLNNYHVYISAPKDILKLSKAPADEISFNGVTEEVLFKKYTLHNNIPEPDSYNSVAVVSLKKHLKCKLPAFQPRIQKTLELSLEQVSQGRRNADGMIYPFCKTTVDADGLGWLNLSVSTLGSTLGRNMSAAVLLGEDLTSDPAIFKTIMQYSFDFGLTIQVLKFLPAIFRPLVGPLMMHWRGAESTLYKTIYPVIEARINQVLGNKEQPLDVIQFMIDSRRKDRHSAIYIYQRTLGLLFAASQQVSMMISFLLYNLCKYQEHLEPLRNEAKAMSALGSFGVRNEDTPLMDSFLKESARLHPTRTLTMERKVMRPNDTFLDGLHIPQGNWLAVPHSAIMKDAALYPDPDRFDPNRFLIEHNGVIKSKSRFSQPSMNFLYWGSIQRACPARFFVSMLAKVILRHLLLHYEFKLVDENASSTLCYDTVLLPHPRLRMLLRERTVTSD